MVHYTFWGTMQVLPWMYLVQNRLDVGRSETQDLKKSFAVHMLLHLKHGGRNYWYDTIQNDDRDEPSKWMMES